jgi:hypothetical protein
MSLRSQKTVEIRVYLLMEGSGFGSVQIITDPDHKGPKTNGSFGSGTLLEVVGCLDFWAVMMYRYLPSNSMGTDSELKATTVCGRLLVAEIFMQAVSRFFRCQQSYPLNSMFCIGADLLTVNV